MIRYSQGNPDWDIYSIVWNLIDDAESPNRIQGSWKGQIRRAVNIEQ